LEDEFEGENFEEEEFDEDQDVEGEDFKQQWNSILVNLYQLFFDQNCTVHERIPIEEKC
jgi:hypothetical protein